MLSQLLCEHVFSQLLCKHMGTFAIKIHVTFAMQFPMKTDSYNCYVIHDHMCFAKTAIVAVLTRGYSFYINMDTVAMLTHGYSCYVYTWLQMPC